MRLMAYRFLLAFSLAAFVGQTATAQQSLSAYVVANTPLPTSTYSNGAGGIGATITETGLGNLTIDYLDPLAGYLVLINGEADKSRNGLYVVTNSGSAGSSFVLTRSTSMDESAEFNSYVWISNGAVYGKTGWTQITPLPIVVGTSEVVFSDSYTPSGGAISYATPSTAVTSDALSPTPGTLSTVARSDARNVALTGLPSTLTPNSTVGLGSSSALARADHVHPMNGFQERLDAGTYQPSGYFDAGTYAGVPDGGDAGVRQLSAGPGIILDGSLSDQIISSYPTVDGGIYVGVSGAGTYSTLASLYMPNHTLIQTPFNADFVGGGFFSGITGSGGGSSAIDAYGMYRQNITGAVSGNSQNQSSVNAAAIYAWDPVLVMKQSFQRTTNIRWFAGFAETTCQPVTADDPANNAIGFQFSTARGDTSIQYMLDNGTTESLTPSGVSFSADIPLVFAIEYSSTGPSVTWTILTSGIKGGTTSGAIAGTLTVTGANVPVSTKNALVCAGASTLTAATVYFRTYTWNLTNRN